MFDTFRGRVLDLRRRGVVARDLSGRSVTRSTERSIRGFLQKVLSSVIVVFATLGFIFLVGTVALGSTGHWLASAHDRTVIDGINTAKIDISTLSTADLAARLRYSPEEGRTIVDLARGEGQTMIEETASALSSLPADRRREAFMRIVRIAKDASLHPSKAAFVDWALSLDDVAAWAIVKFGGPIGDVLHRLSNMTPLEIHTIVTSDFQIQPLDETRGRLWVVINNRRFPASNLVEPLAELAATSPDKIGDIKRFLRDKTPLPSCRPTACTPAACSLTGVICASGYRATMGQPICIPYSNDGWAK